MLKKIQIVISILGIVSYILLYLLIPTLSDGICAIIKFFLCWVGIIELGYIFVTWKKKTKKFLSLYTIFMLFMFLFNYGQCFLWAIGIHEERELGSMYLYNRLLIPNNQQIVLTQLIVLISGLMIHSSAILSKKNSFKKNYKPIDNKYLLIFCKILCPIVIFSEFYFQIVNYKNAQIYGYTALYYNTNVQSVNVVFQILARLFFPCIIGLLIGSEYKNKRIMNIVYILFGIDVILSLMVGDRGGWIYSLLILVLCHHTFRRKFKIKGIIIGGLVGYTLMIVMIAVKRLRNSGVSIEGILGVFGNILVSPITETLIEMGGTMGVTLAFVMQGWKIFPYGNSFFWGLITSPSKRIIKLLNLNYENIGSWFSQSYLRISNGAGFSIIAEVLANFGPYLLPIIMILVGYIIFKITNIEGCTLRRNGIYIFYRIILTNVVINISRNAFNYNMGEVFYTVIVFYTGFEIFKLFIKQLNIKK